MPCEVYTKAKQSKAKQSKAKQSKAKHFNCSFSDVSQTAFGDGLFSCHNEGEGMKNVAQLTPLDFENYFRLAKRSLDFIETVYFQKFMEFIKNKDLFEKVRWANDTHMIPPVETFLKEYDAFFKVKGPIKKMHRADLTASFGYLFCVVLNGGYTGKRVRKGCVKAKEYGYAEATCYVREVKK